MKYQNKAYRFIVFSLCGLRLSHLPGELYDYFIEGILQHIVFIYATEIILIALTVVIGIVSEKGFDVCG